MQVGEDNGLYVFIGCLPSIIFPLRAGKARAGFNLSAFVCVCVLYLEAALCADRGCVRLCALAGQSAEDAPL